MEPPEQPRLPWKQTLPSWRVTLTSPRPQLNPGVAMLVFAGVDLERPDAHCSELAPHPLRMAVPLIHCDLLLDGLPTDTVGVVRELIHGFRDHHRHPSLGRVRQVVGDTHPILNCVLLILFEGHGLRLIGARNTSPIHELWSTWPQDVVANHDGCVRQHLSDSQGP
eukprot:UN3565